MNGAAAFAVGVPCAIDASAFLGIEFTIKGTAGTPSELRLEIGFAENTQGSRFPTDPRFGICEMDCTPASAMVPVTATETRIQLPWSMFHGGGHQYSVNPSTINNIA